MKLPNCFILSSVTNKKMPGKKKLVMASLNAPMTPKTTLRSSTSSDERVMANSSEIAVVL